METIQDYTFIRDLAALPGEIAPESITSRKLLTAGRLKAVLFSFAAGQELTEHTSARRAVVHIVSGEAQIALGEETLDAGPGSWVHMEPGLPHGLKALTDMVMILLLIDES
jgi:quercetin dioxygenase-like cupin family protein